MSTDLDQIFAASGVDFQELQRTEHAARAKAQSMQKPTSKPVSFSPPINPHAVACPRCKAVLEPHEEFICDKCDNVARGDGKPKLAAVSEPVEFAPCWPQRHVRRLPEFHGPAHEKAKNLYSMIESGAMLLLHGPQGRGKTGMATWWEHKRIHSGLKAGHFDTAQGILSRIKASWAGKGTDELISELCKAPFLVMDEMDERAHSEWEEYMLFDILNRRYNDELPTVMISNLMSVQEIAERFRTKVLARINENGGLVFCNWESYR